MSTKHKPTIRYVTTGFFTLVLLGVTPHSIIFLSDETGPSNANQQRTNQTHREGAEDCQTVALRYVACRTKRGLLRSVTGTWTVNRYVANRQKTLTVKHLSCQPKPATAKHMGNHPTLK